VGNANALARSLLCFIMRDMLNLGWIPVSAADVSYTCEKRSDNNLEPKDVYSFWFAKPEIDASTQVPFSVATANNSASLAAENGSSNGDRNFAEPPAYEEIMGSK